LLTTPCESETREAQAEQGQGGGLGDSGGSNCEVINTERAELGDPSVGEAEMARVVANITGQGAIYCPGRGGGLVSAIKGLRILTAWVPLSTNHTPIDSENHRNKNPYI